MKFILLVEGKTERDAAAAFLKRWLDPRLRQAVGIQTVPFDGYADLIHKMATKAGMHLTGPKQAEIVAVIALLDLYGPTFYPSDKTGADDRYEWGRAHFEKQVNLTKFRMFFAVHEFEAWLLSQPDVFPREVRNSLPNTITEPERVNFDLPPAKLLDRIYNARMRRNYKKTTYGKQLFARLDPAVAHGRCPYLRALLDEMLRLARAAGL